MPPRAMAPAGSFPGNPVSQGLLPQLPLTEHLLPRFGVTFQRRKIGVSGAQKLLPPIPLQGPVQNRLHRPLLFLGQLPKQLVSTRADTDIGSARGKLHTPS